MNNETHLEPRVARLETSMETLTRNVGDLTNTVQRIATNIDDKFEKLNIGLTQAQAPKRTDWSLLLTIGFFILALGSAIFWPLNKNTQDNHTDIQTLSQKFDEHTKLTLHPVGQALLGRLENQLQDHIALNERELKEHRKWMNMSLRHSKNDWKESLT